MSNAELKNKLKEKIENLNEDYFLEELLDIIDLESDKSSIIEIPVSHKKKLDVSLNQMDDAQTTSHNKVMKDLEDDLKD